MPRGFEAKTMFILGEEGFKSELFFPIENDDKNKNLYGQLLDLQKQGVKLASANFNKENLESGLGITISNPQGLSHGDIDQVEQHLTAGKALVDITSLKFTNRASIDPPEKLQKEFFHAQISAILSKITPQESHFVARDYLSDSALPSSHQSKPRGRD